MCRGSVTEFLYTHCRPEHLLQMERQVTDFQYACCRPEHVLQLPPDLLTTILGGLDIPTLCTARLVCKDFCESGSGHLVALRLPSTALDQPPKSLFTQLSGLKKVEVSVATQVQLDMLAHPWIAPVITHLILTLDASPPNMDRLFNLPKLRSLSLCGKQRGIERLPAGLEELFLGFPIKRRAGLRTASWLTELSGLTRLSILLKAGAGQALGCLTCLQNLRALDLHCGQSALWVLGRFTMLTALRWRVTPSEIRIPKSTCTAWVALKVYAI